MGTSGLPSETHFTPPLTERGRALPPFLAPSEAYRKQIYDNTMADLELRGWEAASVIYLLPWSLSLDGPAHQERKIRGVPLDEKEWKVFLPRLKLKGGLSIPYVHYPVLNPYISIGTGFQGPNITESQPLTSAHVSYPMQLAEDVVQQANRHESQGGVFCYKGIHAPFAQEKTREH
jgi:hypothetical protein